jgi:hypothetical protein
MQYCSSTLQLYYQLRAVEESTHPICRCSLITVVFEKTEEGPAYPSMNEFLTVVQSRADVYNRCRHAPMLFMMSVREGCAQM